jgi:hypothetical protein
MKEGRQRGDGEEESVGIGAVAVYCGVAYGAFCYWAFVI